MDIIPTTNTTILHGQRLITATGYDAADKYPTPRDCVVPIFDSEKDIFYIKTTDTNGGSSTRMFSFKEEPIPRFDPDKYVTTDELKSFKEDILDAINTLRSTINSSNTTNGTRSNQQGSNRSNNRSGNE